MLAIRPLTIEDLPLAMRLKQQAGWNQTEQDLRRFVALSAGGSFVAEWQGQSVGLVMTFEFGSQPSQAVAWVAMMLVDQQLRGQGIGRALMQRALEHLDQRGVASIRLDATPLGQPLYETLGFEPQFKLSRYAGTLPASSPPALLAPADPLAELDDIARLDCKATNTDRRALLARLIAEHPQELRIVRREGELSGYVLSRPGHNARQVGPCIADAQTGSLLIEDAFSRYGGQKVYIDVPQEHDAASALAAGHGLAVQRELTRMCRGRKVLEQTPLVWASSSPEKG